MYKQVENKVANRTLTLETGKMAKQSDGAVLVQYGDTVVLVTAVASMDAREGIDFFPLTVNYQEMTYAAGKIPGGFFKREGRPSEKEILTSRLIDRPIRPLFPKNFLNETQIIATVLSVDNDNDPDMASIIGASAALTISDIPFMGPIAGVKIGKIDNDLILNPTYDQLKKSDLNLVVVGNKDAIMIVGGEAKSISEEDILEAIFFGHDSLQGILELQEELCSSVGKEKRKIAAHSREDHLAQKVREATWNKTKEAVEIKNKIKRREIIKEIQDNALELLLPEYEGRDAEIKIILEEQEREIIRELIIKEKRRMDGRRFDEIRPITCEVGLLPRTHGSALFTRGETQALAVTTLGTSNDEQRIDSLNEETSKSFMLHYNFPPFSVGEVRFLRGTSRREVGHGSLAERALISVLPDAELFPYTIRIVSEILESNGSSSMATVCGASLSLMDAGVPINAPVAGIAMGLIKAEGEMIILSDILGDEDHAGDMDLKVVGTAEGITALQMDIKVGGITREILGKALSQAKNGRLHILEEMKKGIEKPRDCISSYAPRIVSLQINPEKIAEVIGPRGKVIKGIIEETGAKIEVEDSGKISIASTDNEATERAIEIIKSITQEAEIGAFYLGKVKKIVDFGAFVEIFPGTDGLVHISQLANERVKSVSDVLKEGDEVLVKVIDVDQQGKIRLSRKAALGQTKTK